MAQGCVSDSRHTLFSLSPAFFPRSHCVCVCEAKAKKKNAIWEGHICDVGNVVLLAPPLTPPSRPPTAHKSFLSVFSFFFSLDPRKFPRLLSLSLGGFFTLHTREILRATYIDRYLRMALLVLAREGDESESWSRVGHKLHLPNQQSESAENIKVKCCGELPSSDASLECGVLCSIWQFLRLFPQNWGRFQRSF